MTQLEGRPACREGENTSDRGSMLVLAMLLVMVGGIMVFPLIDYSSGLIRQGRVAHTKVARVEAVKGGLRMALADPMQLYRICGGTNVTSPISLNNSGISVPVASSCAQVSQASATETGRYANAITGAGVPLPPELSRLYPGSASSNVNSWIADSTALETTAKVWMPDLPMHDLSTRNPAGWTMPSSYGSCTVFFPGTYTSPVTLNQARDYYFTSGVYYFTRLVTVSDPARVVVGSGSAKGCASDQEAAFDAFNAPLTHAITGAGATFVFGEQGGLSVTTPSTTGAVRLLFNQRYVDPTDVNTLPSAGVSIMSVNGQMSANGDLVDHSIPNTVRVPFSMVGGATRKPATEQAYAPSTRIPGSNADPAGPAGPHIVHVNIASSADVTVSIPGYVAVPQGRISVDVYAAIATSPGTTRVLFEGGVLARAVNLSLLRPTELRFDIVLPVVQRMFKITTATTSGLPVVTSTALIQVNQNGAFAVNSWVVG